MKLDGSYFKLTLVLLLTGLITILATNVALAKNGPHAGPGMPQDTDACAGCHRAHTGTVAGLLKEGENVYSFCSSCHNGTGANANVLSGTFEGDQDIVYNGHNSRTDGEAGKGLNSGGFLQAAVYSGRSSRGNFADITSRHNLEGLDGSGPWTAWGGGTDGPGTSITLKCTSCHDPHGTENSDGSERYRVLLNSVNGTAVGLIKSNEGATKDYTKDQYNTGTAAFCAACHTQYLGNPITPYDAGDGKGTVTRYRHKVNVPLSNGDLKTGNGKPIAQNLNEHTPLPVEQSSFSATISGSDILVCLSCHQAHGTRATVSASATVAPANSSTLLRLNNRGVCQDCHQK